MAVAEKQKVEADRRIHERRRGEEALQLCRGAHHAQHELKQQQLDKRWQIRTGENDRARLAAEAGRDVSLARRAAEQEAEAERQEVQRLSPRRVRLIDQRGNVDYTKTYFHAMIHTLESDEPGVVAELNRPLSPAPAVSELQQRQAVNRGRIAEALLATRRQDAELERRLAAAEAKSRMAKTQRVVDKQAAVAPGASTLGSTWGILEGFEIAAAEAEMQQILGDAADRQAEADSASKPVVVPAASSTQRLSSAW